MPKIEIKLDEVTQEALGELMREYPGLTPDQVMGALVQDYIDEQKGEGA